MTKKTDPPTSRKSRRVSWKPEGSSEAQFQDERIDTREEDYADRTPASEEQLKRDKPPHWG